MASTLQQLVSVRSALAEDLRKYYRAVSTDLDPNYGKGRRMRHAAVRPLCKTPVPGKPLNLTGDPGIGKSFLAASWCAAVAGNAASHLDAQDRPLHELRLPIPVDLRRLAGAAVHDDDDPVDVIVRVLHNCYPVSPRLEALIRGGFKDERCWLVLDSFDQVRRRRHARRDRDFFLQRIAARVTDDWRCRVLLTRRNASPEPWVNASVQNLLPLNRQQVLRLIDTRFAGNTRDCGLQLQAYFSDLWGKVEADPTPQDREIVRLAGIPRELCGMCRAYDLARYSPWRQVVWPIIYLSWREVCRIWLWVIITVGVVCFAVLFWALFGQLRITFPEDGAIMPHMCTIRGRRPVWQQGVVLEVRPRGEDRWWEQKEGEYREDAFGRWATEAMFGRANDDVGVVFEIRAKLGSKKSPVVTVTRE